MEPGQRQWGLETAPWVSGQRGGLALPLEEAPLSRPEAHWNQHISAATGESGPLPSQCARPLLPCTGEAGALSRGYPIKHGPLRGGHRTGFLVYLCHNLLENRNENCMQKYNQGDFFHLTYVERKHQSD